MIKDSPLIYSLGMIQFPKVPGMERFIDLFLDAIRKEYPLVDEVKIPVFGADCNSQGFQMVWQFASIDRKWGFVLTDQVLCLHTVDYRDFSNFSDCFQKGLEALLKVPGIGIDWVTAIGIRYVNLVVAKGSYTLKDYLDSWVLPAEPPRSQLSIIEGAYVARYKTAIGELRLQSMRNPQYTLPPELHSPFIAKNGWLRSRPKEDFALIDIDHSMMFSQPESMKILESLQQLKALHEVSKEIFLSFGTEFSQAAWR